MKTTLFKLIPGRIYKRSKVHDLLGGQRFGGISTPKGKPYILLFSGDQGEKYGYKDEWRGNAFYYYGEGQLRDMQFLRGNRAIRDHMIIGKDLLLFEYVRPGMVKFTGPMICDGYEIVQAPDITGRMRRAIRFRLLPQPHHKENCIEV